MKLINALRKYARNRSRASVLLSASFMILGTAFVLAFAFFKPVNPTAPHVPTVWLLAFALIMYVSAISLWRGSKLHPIYTGRLRSINRR